MKKLMKKINFALIGLMVYVPAFAVTTTNAKAGDIDCGLVTRLQQVFKVLRTAALIGMAFYLASWAWGYISKGEAKVEDVKKQGVAVIVGVAMLFMISVILTFVLTLGFGNVDVKCKINEGWD